MEKKKYFLCLSLIVFNFFVSAQNLVRVQVNNIDIKKGGQVLIAVFDKKGFPTVGAQFQGKKKIVQSNTCTFDFDLPNGNFAFAVFQDVNMSNHLNKTWVGFPKEPYGFSRNFKPTIRAPRFSEVSINISASFKETVLINLLPI